MSTKTIESQTLGDLRPRSQTLGTKTLTPEQAATVRNTLDLARSGRATLIQLAVAHDLVSGAALNGCLGELRTHIRHMVSPTPLHITGKDLALGVVSGVFTHLLLRDI